MSKETRLQNGEKISRDWSVSFAIWSSRCQCSQSINGTPLITYLSTAVCKALGSGVAGIFGPQSGTTSSHIQSICDTLEIPHIETRWDYRLTRDDYSVNLYPHPQALGKVSSMYVRKNDTDLVEPQTLGT